MALPYSISRGHYLPLPALVPCFGLDNNDASLLILIIKYCRANYFWTSQGHYWPLIDKVGLTKLNRDVAPMFLRLLSTGFLDISVTSVLYCIRVHWIISIFLLPWPLHLPDDLRMICVKIMSLGVAYYFLFVRHFHFSLTRLNVAIYFFPSL